MLRKTKKNPKSQIKCIRNIIKKEGAITLVVLVVTIIVLLILAAIAINLSLGDNGLFRRAKEVTESYEKEQIRENQLLQNIANALNKNKENDELEELPIIQIENETKWSKEKNVSITLEDGYITKYTIDGSDPSIDNGLEYKEEIKVDKNCIIKAVYIDENNRIGRISEKEITKIDKLSPNNFNITLTPGKKSVMIEIESSVSDNEPTQEDGSSGIASFKYNCKYNGKDHIIETIEKSYEFEEIYGDLTGVNCEIIVEAIDNAENIQTAKSSTTTTCYDSKYYKNLNTNTYYIKNYISGTLVRAMRANSNYSGLTWVSYYTHSSDNLYYYSCGVISTSEISKLPFYGIESSGNEERGTHYIIEKNGYTYHCYWTPWNLNTGIGTLERIQRDWGYRGTVSKHLDLCKETLEAYFS